MKLETQPPAPPKEIWCVLYRRLNGGEWELVGPFDDSEEARINGRNLQYVGSPEVFCYQLKPGER